MRKLTFALAGAAALIAAPAASETVFTPASFANLAHVFNAADLDRNGVMSSREYVMFRTGLIDSRWVRDYRGDDYERMVPTVVRSFAQLDRDNDAMISRTEFMNVANDPIHRRWTASSADRWDWAPEYITLGYYLTANPVDTDTFDLKPVINLDGETIGRIQGIARHEETGDHFALVRWRERTMDPTPSQYRGGVIGVPLEEILLSSRGASLMLSRRGEEFLIGSGDMPRVDASELEEVDTLYRT